MTATHGDARGGVGRRVVVFVARWGLHLGFAFCVVAAAGVSFHGWPLVPAIWGAMVIGGAHGLASYYVRTRL